MPISETGDLLLALKTSIGLSRNDVAELAGVKDRQVGRWLRDEPKPPSDIIESLWQIAADIEALTASLLDQASSLSDSWNQIDLIVFRSNDHIRASPFEIPMPIRGQAKGLFTGPYLIGLFDFTIEIQQKLPQVIIQYHRFDPEHPSSFNQIAQFQ